MIRGILCVGLLTLLGCASLRNQVGNDIHDGDTKDQVRIVIGEPDITVNDSDTAQDWYYTRRGDTCIVKFITGTVVNRECTVNTAYHQRMNAAAASFGNSSQYQSAGDYALRGRCSPIAPMAPSGCHMSCINGQWASVCR